MLVGNAKAFIPQLRSLGLTDVEIIPVDQLDLMSASLKRETGRRVSFEPFGRSNRSNRSNRSRERSNRRSVATTQPAYQATQVNRAGGGAPTAPAPNDRAALDLLRRVVDARRPDGAEGDPDGGRGNDHHVPDAAGHAAVHDQDLHRLPGQVQGRRGDQRRADDAGLQLGRGVGQEPGRNSDAPPAMAADFAASVRRDIIPLLIDAAEGRLTVRRAADQAARDGRPVQVLEISGAKLDRVRLFIDQQMLIVGQAYTVTTPGPQPRTLLSEEIFSDYRFVSGIRSVRDAQLLQNGQP